MYAPRDIEALQDELENLSKEHPQDFHIALCLFKSYLAPELSFTEAKIEYEQFELK